MPTVQWQRAADGGDFEDLPGATSATYTFTPVAADDRATFRAVFTNPYGSDSSFGAWLTLDDLPSATDLAGDGRVRVGHAGDPGGTGDDGDVLAYSVVDQPAHGTLSGNAPALTYTPDDGYSGRRLLHLPGRRRHGQPGARDRLDHRDEEAEHGPDGEGPRGRGQVRVGHAGHAVRDRRRR